MMQGQFLGMIYTGAWLCLDEFNRIDIEVLSVIAQQILCMRNALNSKVESFMFDGMQVKSEDFKYLGVFTTMNPGYAGRTELPDNLKVLFRPVSMMVPDYASIAEILLYSEGFKNAQELAVKLTKLYKLASEQLSQQKHYDFGMRAVKSILSMAGILKRENPENDEDLLLIQAMKDVNLPKFLEDDKKLFNAIVSDLFPGKHHEKYVEDEFLRGLEFAVKELNIKPVLTFMEKCSEFNDILKIRFGSMLVGPPMTGKSTVLHTVRTAYDHLNFSGESKNSFYRNIDAVFLNPKSITMGELYGETNPLTGDFKNGLASKFFSDFAVRETKEFKWIIFDGPVDSLWIESLNSVLDDSRTLCLANGKRIRLKDDMRVFFEVEDLNQASPATVSRVGMVYLDDGVVEPLDIA